MIKLSKKITRAIEREYLTSDFTIIKRVYIHSMFKQLCVNLVMFRIGQSRSTIILRYFGDNSYSILGQYNNEQEIQDELINQLKKLY